MKKHNSQTPSDPSTGDGRGRDPQCGRVREKGRTSRLFLSLLLLPIVAIATTPQDSDKNRGNAEIRIAQGGTAGARQISIPAGKLTDALKALANQTGVDVIFPSEQLKDLKTKGFTGTLDTQQAFLKLLEGTQLVLKQEGTSIIVSLPARASLYRNGKENTGEGSLNTGTLRLAQNTGTENTGAQATEMQKVNKESASADSESTRNTESDDSSSSKQGISEILVVGSRSQNVDIRRSENGAQPYVIFGEEEIKNSAAANVEEFLRSRLPMNAQEVGSLQTTGAPNEDTAGRINLRGLGTNQTLILVDGRRMPGVATGFTIGQPNISGIPASAIERIEVLPATASGIYGGSATGGVINIVTKRDYSGLNIYSLYGNTFHSDVDRLEFGLDGGFNFNKGHTKITFRASHQAQDDLLGTDRSFARKALGRFIENDPTSSGVRSTAYGVLPNVFSSNGSNLVLDFIYGGQSLNSPWTSIPEDYTGFLTDNAAALLSNAGKLHLEGRPAVLSRSPTVNSAGMDIRNEFSPSLEAFASAAWNKSITEGTLPHSFALTLPANSLNNPFQQNIVVNVSLEDLRFPTSSESSSLFLNAGLIKRFSGGWTASLEYAWSRSHSSFESATSFSPSATGLPIIQGALLRDWHLFPSSELESLFNLQRTDQSTKITLQDYSLRLGGPLLGLPGGPVTLTALIEYRDESASQSTLRSELQPFPVEYIWFPPASQSVWSGYGEIRAPIFSQKNGSPLFRALELTAAVRYDSYSIRFAGDTFLLLGPQGPFPSLDYSHSTLNFTDYSLGAIYKPVLGVELRGSLGTGSLPPTLSQIRENLTSVLASTTGFLDPKRGGEVLIGDPTSSPSGLLEQSITGGPGLKPEKSRSLHIGAVLEPKFLAPLRLSVDYVEIRKKGEIALFGGQYFLDNEDIYPDRIVRGPSLPGDPVGWAGPVIFLDRSFVNIFKTKVRAVDFQVDYSMKTSDLGIWRFYLVGTRNLSFKSQRSLASDPLNTIGASDGPLKWRGNIGFDWSNGSWAAGWNAQYYSKRSLCSAGRLAADTCAAFNIVLAQGEDSVADQIYHDIYAKYSFDQSLKALNGTEITLGIQNLFDKSPPIIARGGPYSLFGDPRLQRFTIAVRRNF